MNDKKYTLVMNLALLASATTLILTGHYIWAIVIILCMIA